MILALILTLSCPETRVVNETSLKWNKHDTYTLNSVKYQCKIHYPNSPCLKLFIKKGYQNYWAICGKK